MIQQDNQSRSNYNKNTVIKTIQNIQLAYENNSLIDDKLIKQYQEEKSKNYSKIDLEYAPDKKVVRLWQKSENKKVCYPNHLVNDKWINNTGEEVWLPYRHIRIRLAENQWMLIHEGEKATDFALFKGIISTCVLGAKAYDEEYLLGAINLLQALDIQGAIYIADEDGAGLKKAKAFQEIAYKNDFTLLILPINFILPSAQKGDDFVEYLQANQNKSTEQIVLDIESKVKCFSHALTADFLSY